MTVKIYLKLEENSVFLIRVKTSKVICLFTTKGGVLKTTIGLNVARAAAISGMKTLVIGLDMQGDMTNAIVGAPVDEDKEDFQKKHLRKIISGVFMTFIKDLVTYLILFKKRI